MRRKKTEEVGNIAHQVLRELGIETPYNEYRLLQAWPEIMGEGISRMTGEMFIRNRVLYVKINSPAMRMNLAMERTRLVYRLNQYIGAQVIEKIVFT